MSSLWHSLTGGNRAGRKTEESASLSSSPAATPNGTQATETAFVPDDPQPKGTGIEINPAVAPGAEVFSAAPSVPSYLDPSRFHPLANLDRETVEYLTLDDIAPAAGAGGNSVIPSRGFTDDMCYGSGVTYLGGLTVGGAMGLREGLIRSADMTSPKLRLNATLNSITRRGPYLGNSAGAVAIMYNCINALIGQIRGKHDAANSILAGTLSGALFASTRGPRQTLISAGVVGSIATAWTVFRRAISGPPESTLFDQNAV